MLESFSLLLCLIWNFLIFEQNFSPMVFISLFLTVFFIAKTLFLFLGSLKMWKITIFCLFAGRLLNVILRSKFWSADLGGTVVRALMQTESSGKGSQGMARMSLVCGQIDGSHVISEWGKIILTVDWFGRAQSTVGSDTLGKAVLGCGRKLSEHKPERIIQ